MKIVIICDTHSNFVTLDALPEKGHDHLWCLDDLVDYGPGSNEVIEWVRTKTAVCLRVNHDHAVGSDEAPISLAGSIREIRAMPVPKEDPETLIAVFENGPIATAQL